MSRVGVICEFNPFHNGHKFLLEKIKSEYGDEIVCVMSGNFVQRGDIVITDKYARTCAALQNGADIVIELPTAYAVSSARIFAENGVRAAAAMGCDRLCFGAESDTGSLTELSELLMSDDINRKIREYMDEGMYYPKALSLAVGEGRADIISQPNNILALEYIRACKERGILPAAIERRGAAHDSRESSADIASASMIRGLIESGEDYHSFTPMTIEKPCSLNAIETAILYRLKTIGADELAQIAEVDEGLENRLTEAAKKYNSTEEILSAVKTKRYTMARLRRIVIQTVLGITSEIQNTPLPYLRALGLRSGRESMLSGATLPLIVKVKADYDRLDNSAKEIFSVDLRAAELMNIAQNSVINEFTQGVIKQQ